MIGSGNRCGHNPAAPRLDPVEHPSDRLLPVFYDVAAAAENLYWMRRHRDFRAYHRCRRPKPRPPEASGKRRNHEFRRSEFAEAMVLVVKALVVRADLVTGRVQAGKTRDDGTVCGITAERLAEITGLHISRVNRVLGVLVREELIFSCQPSKLKDDGKYQGYPAIRTISPKLLRLLRVNMKWEIAAKKAYEERKEERAAAARQLAADEAARMAQTMRHLNQGTALGEIPTTRGVHGRRRREAAHGDRVTERGQRLVALKLEIWRANPQWPPERVDKAARAKLDRQEPA